MLMLFHSFVNACCVVSRNAPVFECYNSKSHDKNVSSTQIRFADEVGSGKVEGSGSGLINAVESHDGDKHCLKGCGSTCRRASMEIPELTPQEPGGYFPCRRAHSSCPVGGQSRPILAVHQLTSEMPQTEIMEKTDSNKQSGTDRESNILHNDSREANLTRLRRYHSLRIPTEPSKVQNVELLDPHESLNGKSNIPKVPHWGYVDQLSKSQTKLSHFPSSSLLGDLDRDYTTSSVVYLPSSVKTAHHASKLHSENLSHPGSVPLQDTKMNNSKNISGSRITETKHLCSTIDSAFFHRPVVDTRCDSQYNLTVASKIEQQRPASGIGMSMKKYGVNPGTEETAVTLSVTSRDRHCRKSEGDILGSSNNVVGFQVQRQLKESQHFLQAFQSDKLRPPGLNAHALKGRRKQP
ncbi:unnamed protein product [Protopolystoma xenopodis]|uniref:Uncharacterized protein n=1 Tax=Protopolystoma xenopodis TaxID=117903 RepID=A0A3S5CF23_9PLAT|nr:unnamed protein product [Protopolystoma xenopodis]